MKAITIYQPWASLIAVGAKRYETRSWATKHRGKIAIHAGKKRPSKLLTAAEYEFYRRAMGVLGYDSAGRRTESSIACPLGAVIATAEIVECWEVIRKDKHGAALLVNRIDKYDDRIIREPVNELLFGDFTPGRYAWELANVKLLDTPIPVKGKQGLWEWKGE
jgi:hypothetical protein